MSTLLLTWLASVTVTPKRSEKLTIPAAERRGGVAVDLAACRSRRPAPPKLAAIPPPGPLLVLPLTWLPLVIVTPPSKRTIPPLYIPTVLLLFTWLCGDDHVADYLSDPAAAELARLERSPSTSCR